MTNYEPLDASRCDQCDAWVQCPGCEQWGWCIEDEEFTERDDCCAPQDRWGRL